MKLEMAEDLIINLNEPPFNTEGLIGFFCGKTGAGKSYALIKMLEQAYKQKYQFVFLDPHGEGHVLADQSFDTRGGITVISERYGIPVSVEAIPVYVSIIKSGRSVVIDLAKLFKREKKKFNEFVEQFIREFDAEWSDVRTPILLVIDEAHFFAPQKIRKGDSSAARRVDLITDLSTGGRKYGISQIYSTQRPALFDKSPITQANFRLFGKVTSTQDWNAIKEHVKETILRYDDDKPVCLRFIDIKGFTSGTFVANIGDEAKVIKVAKRETKDAGKTPTYKAQLSSKAQLSIADITKQIRDAIESARADKEQDEETAKRLTRLERNNERLKAELKDTKFQLDTVNIVERRMAKAPDVAVRQVVVESMEEAKVQMRKEFDSELRELRKRHKAIVSEKDTEIAGMSQKVEGVEDAMTRIKAFQIAARDLLGTDAVSEVSVSYDEDTIVKKVLAKIPATGGQTVIVEAPEALALEWERKQLVQMTDMIGSLAQEEVVVLSYLIVVNKVITITGIAKAVLGSSSGSNRNKVSPIIKALKTLNLVRESKGNGFKQDIAGFVRHFVGEFVEDITQFEQHVIYAVKERV